MLWSSIFFGYWIGYWIGYGADADMGISCNVMVREDVWSVKHCSALSLLATRRRWNF